MNCDYSELKFNTILPYSSVSPLLQMPPGGRKMILQRFMMEFFMTDIL